jgi:outer membrane protein OmpA-like peptidoglycan-associated protein
MSIVKKAAGFAAIGYLGLVGVTVQAQSTQAQSTMVLQSEPLFEDAPAPAAAPNCLRTPDHPNCAGSGGQSGRTFSLSDVVNLGIIDRSELEADAAAAGEDVAIAASVDPLPSIDLEILFDYASDDLRADQLPPLVALSRDLQEIDFGRARLVLMGHTDGVGSAAYNRQLSQRRAESVAEFLSASAGIPRSRISVSGQGFDFLLYPNDPAHPGNRRVQVLLVE